MSTYDPKKIEARWQKYWEKSKLFEVNEDESKKKFYGLVEFPYPSGAGLHVGHPRPFTAMDVICRKKRMEGYNVLYPMGFDAFGLPTENYAIKTGRPPAEVTAENIANFTRQLKMLGYSFDWSRVVDTTDPKYYKWTQWIFLQLFKHGLAYKKAMPINWCPKDKTGLANEEVVDGKCERCGTPVEKRHKEQWMLAITKYADKLLAGLNQVDYIPQAKIQQEDWIGKSEGAEVDFKIKDTDYSLQVFTTRPDTLFGATYMVVAPEHEVIKILESRITNLKEVEKYLATAKNKSDLERTKLQKEKTGVELKGVKAINPVNNEEIPIFVADYVLMGYGTGAIMAVPAHDERDWEFAKKYNLVIKKVVQLVDSKKQIAGECFSGDGVNINSGFLDGLKTQDAKEKMIVWLEEKNIGKQKVQYKLRDWVFSRQRYWGEPIPLVKCENCANKKQKVLIIHGFEGSGEGNWLPWIKSEMEENGFEVFIPTMTTSAHPDLSQWLKELKPFIDQMSENDIVIGHSLGSKAALHLVEKSKKKLKNLFLVASAIGEMNERDWDYLRKEWNDSDVEALKKFWETKIDFNKITNLVDKVQVILSSDDPWIKKKTHENIPKEWDFQVWNGFGHFQEKEIPELLNLFLSAQNTGWIPVPESELPLELPKVKKYEPTDTGESPLAAMDKWVKTKCPVCGGSARRETDTMPNWAGSSWYFLRYCDPKNNKEFASPEKLKYWMNIDWYNGGMEHTVLHLLYSRFWNEFLYDIGVVPTSEPYQKRTSHGMILAPDGEKMSKSRGNVINPDEMVEKFGTDAFRMYIMFMGPFDQAVSWDTNGLIGVRRFLEKVWGLQEKVNNKQITVNSKQVTLLHQTIKKVSEDIEAMRFNTAISQLMILVNEMSREESLSPISYLLLLQLLSPFAPHVAEEIWHELGNKESISKSTWPEYDPKLIVEDTITLAVQVNGKLRDTLEVSADISEEEAKKLALASEKVSKWFDGKEPKKVIYVKGKLLSIVV